MGSEMCIRDRIDGEVTRKQREKRAERQNYEPSWATPTAPGLPADRRKNNETNKAVAKLGAVLGYVNSVLAGRFHAIHGHVGRSHQFVGSAGLVRFKGGDTDRDCLTYRQPV